MTKKPEVQNFVRVDRPPTSTIPKIKMDELQRDIEEARRIRLESVLNGEASELPYDDFMLAVEVDTVRREHNHLRLIRAARLAMLYRPKRPITSRSRKEYVAHVAATCGVDARDLDAYIPVLGNEMRHRDRTGMSPLENLPTLTWDDGVDVIPIHETPALPHGSAPKHDPSVYVDLREQGYNNCEIAHMLGDVTEASVRRGLNKAGYRTSR